VTVAITRSLACAKLTVDGAGKVPLEDVPQKVILVVSDFLAPSSQDFGEILACPQSAVKVSVEQMGGVDGLPSEFAISTGNAEDSLLGGRLGKAGFQVVSIDTAANDNGRLILSGLEPVLPVLVGGLLVAAVVTTVEFMDYLVTER